jgi:tight adherence protein B
LGLPFRDALLNLLERLPLSDMRFLTTALLMQKDTGGNLVQILDTVVFVMKERIRIRGQIKIYTAQARLTAWIVAAMPFVMYLAVNFLNPEYGGLLLKDPTGRIVFYTGIVSWIIGILIIKKIVAVKV